MNTEMQGILNTITECIDAYEALPHKLTFNDCEILSDLLKTVSSNLFYLEKHRDEYKRKHTAILHNLIKDGSPVSKAQIIADDQVPEIYMLRRFMLSGYKLQDSLRTHISLLKNEK